MNRIGYLLLVLIIFSCKAKKETENFATIKNQMTEFPKELVNFAPYEKNPVFGGTSSDTWDKKIRERGYILRTDSIYQMWYSGYNDEIAEEKFIGYATSKDGIHWTRFPGYPVFKE